MIPVPADERELRTTVSADDDIRNAEEAIETAYLVVDLDEPDLSPDQAAPYM